MPPIHTTLGESKRKITLKWKKKKDYIKTFRQQIQQNRYARVNRMYIVVRAV